MTRVQILLTDEQDRKLEALARALRSSKAKLVREGVDLVLRGRSPRARDPLLDLIGLAGRVRRADVATAHDRYLASAKLNRRRK
jgi:hypothetical protein